MTLPSNQTPQTLDHQVAYFPPGATIAFPLVFQRVPFTPNAIYINNRTALSLQFGPTIQGPFTPAGSYTLNVYPWTYGPSLYITSLGGALQATDFLDVHFLAVSTPGGVGVPQITAFAPAGWGPVGPGNSLANVNAGDPFNYGQVQQIINLLTGNMPAQAVIVNNAVLVRSANGAFSFQDQDGVGTDTFKWYALNGFARLFSSVATIDVMFIDESGNLTANAGIFGTGIQASVSLSVPSHFIASTAGIGFFGHLAVSQPTVTGAKGGNVALASLMTALSGMGLVIDNTT